MRTLIKNGLVLPMTAKNDSCIADLLIEDDKIARIEKNIQVEAEEIIDATDKIVMPSFVNCHTHAAMTLMRNYKDSSENLQQWLSQIWPIEDKLVDEDIFYASLLAYSEMIRSGCTTYADMYFNANKSIEATKKAGIRGIIGLTLFGDKEETERRIQNTYPFLEDCIDGYPAIRVDIAPHAIYTCTADTYKIASDWAIKNNRFVHTHLSETKKEVEDCLKENGKRPVEYLDSLGFFESRSYLAHGVHFSDAEIEILKDKKTSIVHNPSSNCKLASGIAPIAKYKNSGLNIALGTDGASSNNNLSIIKEMNLASMLSSVSTERPSAIQPFDIISMATINGARALGLENRIGTLECNKEADILILDCNRVNSTPLNDPYSSIVFSMDKSNIGYVFSRGKMLLEKGMMKTIDEEEVIYKTNKQWKDILSR